MNNYRVSSNLEEMNIDVIHDFISHSYWAKNIPKQTMQKAVDNSLCFGVFIGTDNPQQVAFARLITDKATFAYLADVFVLETHRGKGLSKLMMKEILAHPELQGLRRMVLATRDAHALYLQFGFKALAAPTTFMEVLKINPYLSIA